jgi:uncharacterized membrane protein
VSADANGMHVIEVRCNASLTRGQALAFFAGMVTASLTVALFWTAQGFWPVLPFAGLELFALGLALGLSMRRGRYRELITIAPELITIERGESRMEHEAHLPRPWARVDLVEPSHPWYPSRLYLISHGQRHEIGAVLVESERRGLARRLVELLRSLPERA